MSSLGEAHNTLKFEGICSTLLCSCQAIQWTRCLLVQGLKGAAQSDFMKMKL